MKFVSSMRDVELSRNFYTLKVWLPCPKIIKSPVQLCLKAVSKSPLSPCWHYALLYSFHFSNLSPSWSYLPQFWSYLYQSWPPCLPLSPLSCWSVPTLAPSGHLSKSFCQSSSCQSYPSHPFIPDEQDRKSLIWPLKRPSGILSKSNFVLSVESAR